MLRMCRIFICQISDEIWFFRTSAFFVFQWRTWNVREQVVTLSKLSSININRCHQTPPKKCFLIGSVSFLYNSLPLSLAAKERKEKVMDDGCVTLLLLLFCGQRKPGRKAKERLKKFVVHFYYKWRIVEIQEFLVGEKQGKNTARNFL